MNKRPILLIVLLLIIILSSIIYNVYRANENATKEAQLNMTYQTNIIVNEFSNWIGGRVRLLDSLVDMIDNHRLEDLLAHKTYNPFLRLNQRDYYVSEVYVGLEDGGFITGSNWIPPSNYDPRTRPWYIEAVEKDTTIVSQPYIDAQTGDYMITISKPVYSERDFIGVASIDIFLSSIDFMLQDLLAATPYEAFLVSQQGEIIGDTSKSALIGKPISDLPYIDNPALSFHQVLSDEIHPDPIKSPGRQELVTLSHIKEADWMIGLRVDESIIYASREVFTKTNMIFNVVFLIIIVLVIWYFYHLNLLIGKANANLQEQNKALNDANITIEEINMVLEKKSRVDPLTQIANRGSFDIELDRLWSVGEQEKKEIAMIMIDIDFFKRYNDYYGHVAGDKVLSKLCRIIEGINHEKAFFARFGGEEFALVSAHLNREEVISLANRIVTYIAKEEIPHQMAPGNILTISAGVAFTTPYPGKTMGQFVHEVDMALYRAKKEGKNRVIVS